MGEDKVLKLHITYEPKTKEVKEEKKDDPSKDEKVYGKSKIIAILLALFLGRYGVHKFYLGRPALGFIYLIFSRFQIIFFLSICDIFIYIFMDKKTWLEEYGYRKMPKKKTE